MTEVEVFGQKFPVASMLSAYPQCDQMRAAYRKVTGKDAPDLPIVVSLSSFAPLGLAYFCPTYIQISSRTFADRSVDTVWVINRGIDGIVRMSDR